MKLMMLILVVAFVSAKFKDMHFGTDSDIPFTQVERNFTSQRLNHYDNTDSRTWTQRYWSVEDYFDKNAGVVFIYICGEYTCPGVRDSRLYPVELAKKFGALILVLEHRFYGNSMPFGDQSLKLENLKYLGIRQALDDLAFFINWIKNNKSFGVTAQIPWIAIGGSYPGALSAWLRYQYPHLVIGALASSAVVNVIIDFPQFDQVIYDASKRSGLECTNNIQAITHYVEQQLLVDELGLKKKFSSEFLSDQEFLFMFTDTIVNIIQYGRRTWLCDSLRGKSLNDQLLIIIQIVKEEVDIKDYGSYYLKSTVYNYKEPGSARQWMYQCCSEVGWWQTSPSINSMRSSQLDINFYKNFCQNIFGPHIWPDEKQTNFYFGGDKLNIDNLIFTNGIEDPWQPASILKPQGSLTVRISDCTNCAHCVELYTPTANDSAELKQTRTLIEYQFDQWIKNHYSQQ